MESAWLLEAIAVQFCLLLVIKAVPLARDAEEVEAMAVREGCRLAAEDLGTPVVLEYVPC